ncbi:hypothetical protein EMQ_2208 [Acetobacter aceti NBRC 14818]|uniref:Uncharacterized protein n=1 Tax=Acetobacter aceti NBRC 14818 TaxID=887700 RepID=A0AB33IL22_ACEAC|nr:hypothetical protein EMQ_2208 [Acetobacter aceti NBRC 14818]
MTLSDEAVGQFDLDGMFRPHPQAGHKWTDMDNGKRRLAHALKYCLVCRDLSTRNNVQIMAGFWQTPYSRADLLPWDGLQP